MSELYKSIKAQCGDHCELLVVSKTRSIEQIRHYYDLGVRDFGENRAQELVMKAQQLPSDIRWNFIGHLQRNKVRSVLPYLRRICSLDSLELASVIEKEAAKLNRKIGVLIEFNVADESTKTGLDPEQADSFLLALKEFPHLVVEGIMVMGPHVDDKQQIAASFHKSRQLFDHLRSLADPEQFTICSMGMSHDYPEALQEGSTQLRIGTVLFSE